MSGSPAIFLGILTLNWIFNCIAQSVILTQFVTLVYDTCSGNRGYLLSRINFKHCCLKVFGFVFMQTGLGFVISWTKLVPSNALEIILAFLAFVKLALESALNVYTSKTVLIILISSFVHLATSTFASHNISGNKSDTVRCCHLSGAYSSSSTAMFSNNLKLSLVSNYLRLDWIGIKSGKYSPSSSVSSPSFPSNSKNGLTILDGKAERIFLSAGLSP